MDLELFISIIVSCSLKHGNKKHWQSLIHGKWDVIPDIFLHIRIPVCTLLTKVRKVLDPLSRPVFQTGPWLSSLNVNHESLCLMLFPLPWRSHFSAVTFGELPRCLSQRPAGRQWRQPLNGCLSGCNWFLFLHSLSNLRMNSAVWMSMCGLLSCGQCHAGLPARQLHSQLVLFNVSLESCFDFFVLHPQSYWSWRCHKCALNQCLLTGIAKNKN